MTAITETPAEDIAIGIVRRAWEVLGRLELVPGHARSVCAQWRLHPHMVEALMTSDEIRFNNTVVLNLMPDVPAEHQLTVFGLPVIRDESLQRDELRFEVAA